MAFTSRLGYCSSPATEERALGQVARYLDRAGLDEGWLVLFDLRQEIPWPEKLVIRAREHAGKRVRVVGC